MPPSKTIPWDQLTDEEKDIVKGGGQVTENTRKVREKLAGVIEESKQEAEKANSPLVNVNVPAALGGTSSGTSESDKLKEEEAKEKQRLNHQAYLMFNWEDLTSYSINRPEPFKYFAQVMHNEPAEINNLLFKKPPKFDILLKSKSIDLSYFVPKVRIFKEFRTGKNSVVDIELPLSEGYKEEDFDSIFKSKEGRGGGVGLKSFKWNTIGTSQGNQFSFGAELELFFENISEISKIRESTSVDGKAYSVSFEDLLILKKAPDRTAEGAVYDPDYYRIKALIGWHIPRGTNPPVPPEMIRELEESNLALYMSLVSHEIDIADDSTVTLKIKYIAYIEASMDNPKSSNIFYPEDKNYQVSIEQSKNDIEAEKQKINGSNDAPPLEGSARKSAEDSINSIESKIEQLQTSNKTQVYQRMLNYIYKNNLIKYTTVNPEVLKSFMDIISRPKSMMSSEQQISQYMADIEKLKQNNGKLGSATFPDTSVGTIQTPTDAAQLTANVTETIEAANARLAQSATNGDVVIPYFYMGDLIDSIMKDMYGTGDFYDKEIKLLLGPLVFYDYGRLSDGISLKPPGLSSNSDSGAKTNVKSYTGAKTIINIADIPISLDIFSTWFTKKIVDAGVVNMTMRDFINSIMTDLVIRSVGVDTYSFAPRQKTRLVYKTKTIRNAASRFSNGGGNVPASYSNAASSGQLTKSTGLRFNATQLKLYEVNDVVEEQGQIDNIVLIYSVADQSFELVSDYDMDIKRGIRHIVYGAETGLIKNIKFSRQDNPLIRSHNMRLASKEGAGNGIILREVYNATVEMYGNSLFEIGELIYVSPTLFGSVNSLGFVKNLGIGGYFMILKVNNSIEDGKFGTTLDLKWNAKGDGMPNNLNDGRDNTPNNQGVKVI